MCTKAWKCEGAAAYSARYFSDAHDCIISRSLRPGAPKSSKKMQSNSPSFGSSACHVPATTRTLGRSAAHSRSRTSTGSEHSTMVWLRGPARWIRSAE